MISRRTSDGLSSSSLVRLVEKQGIRGMLMSIITKYRGLRRLSTFYFDKNWGPQRHEWYKV